MDVGFPSHSRKLDESVDSFLGWDENDVGFGKF
jgi:hypothetical protein